jgi:hypothetical protein
MATRPTNRIKATCWTPTIKMDMDGPITAVIAQLFWAVKGEKGRKFLAEKLAEADAKLSEIERLEAEKLALAEPT